MARWLQEYAPHGAAGDLAAIAPRPHRAPVAYLTLVRVLLAQGQAAEALHLLARLRPEEMPAGHRANRVELLALQALALAALGDQAGVARALRLALAQGAQGHYLRTFLDEGPRLGILLRALLTDAQAAPSSPVPALDHAYLTSLLHALHQAYPQAIPAPVPPLPGHPAPLTVREAEVLGLLVAGLSYRAIADRLIVSENTARWHIKNLYHKLQVQDRRALIDRAHELHLPLSAPR